MLRAVAQHVPLCVLTFSTSMSSKSIEQSNWIVSGERSGRATMANIYGVDLALLVLAGLLAAALWNAYELLLYWVML